MSDNTTTQTPLSWSIQLSPSSPALPISFSSILHLFPTLDLQYHSDFISPSLINSLIPVLLNQPNRIQNVTPPDTREKYAFCDFQVSPSWTVGRPWPAQPQDESLLFLREKISKIMAPVPNYALVNIYRDGNDEITWHLDDSEGVVVASSIASVSLGVPRIFQFRPYIPGNRGRTEAWPLLSTSLQSGSLLIMGPQTNEYWCHRLPPDIRITGMRINITFRCLNQDSGSRILPEKGVHTENYERLEKIHNGFMKGSHPVFDYVNFVNFLKNQ